MIPFKDENPTTVFPFVAIGVNVLLYFWELFSPLGEQRIALSYGVIPYDHITHETNQPIPPLETLFASMFLYGILLHLAVTCFISGYSATTLRAGKDISGSWILPYRRVIAAHTYASLCRSCCSLAPVFVRYFFSVPFHGVRLPSPLPP